METQNPKTTVWKGGNRYEESATTETRRIDDFEAKAVSA